MDVAKDKTVRALLCPVDLTEPVVSRDEKANSAPGRHQPWSGYTVCPLWLSSNYHKERQAEASCSSGTFISSDVC